jgi:hypothetical protein
MKPALGVIESFHIVTAAEAAFPSLLGQFTGGGPAGLIEEWVDSNYPQHMEPWPIYLKSLSVEVIRLAVHVHGVQLQLYGMVSRQRPIALVSGVQGYIRRVYWSGESPLLHGVGVCIRAGALAADDVILIGGTYELI